MPESNARNYVALGTLVLAKLCGIAGLVLGYTSHRTEAALLLALDGVLLLASVAMCIRTMREQTKEETGHKVILAQMIREGTLQQYLRDLKASPNLVHLAKLTRDDAPIS